MNTNTVTHKPTILIRIEKALSADRRQQVQDTVSDQPGVLDIQNSKRLPHVILVEYDALRISALKILQSVRNQDKSAFMVAM
ncbi:hypothetical protein [Kaarinaea lacus]